ncbi:MAG TPA: CBS domain-containing protein, partial [Gammaproteobacteria bacterium]|nr:CBS domain-containing protein [Gammaproteobacteria bacterium]
IILGIAASLLFFIAVGLREVVLNSLAINRGIPLQRFTLFAIGGLPQIAKGDTRPLLELLLATTGLLLNLVITGILYAAHSGLVNTAHLLIDGIILWTTYLYALLTIFHFIPVFPLDGGRLLRLLLWKLTDNYDRATNIASWAGQGLGLVLIAYGISLLVLSQQWFNGLILIFVGWVLYLAAAQSRRQTALREALQHIAARDILSGESPIVATPQFTVSQLVRDCILVTGQRYFVVAEEDKLRGVVTISDIRRVPKKRWKSTKIARIMTPASRLKTAKAQQSAASVLELMDELGIKGMPVLENDRVIGVISRDHLNRLNKTRRELGIFGG